MGSSQYNVRQVQTLLNKFGYGLAEDGAWGPKTEAAVRDFQSKHSLSVDGIVGPQTWGALNGQASSAAPAAAAAGATAAPNDIAATYPQWAFLANDPSVGPILRQALSDAATGAKWTDAKLTAAIEATPWWRNNSDTVRQAQALAAINPATAAQNVQQMAEHISTIMQSAGVASSSDVLYGFAHQAVADGWSDEQIKQHVLQSPTTTMTGNAPTRNTVMSDAAAYGVQIDSSTADQWARNLAAGVWNEDMVKGQLMTLAQGKFPSIAKQLQDGFTVAQLFDPYRQQAATDLGISPDSIDLSDPKWNVVFNQPTKNGQVQMTLADWQRYYRTTPSYGYDNSQQARTQSADLAQKMLSEFGAI